jgi:hypothetical protein
LPLHSIPCNLLNFTPELPQGPQNCLFIWGMRANIVAYNTTQNAMFARFPNDLQLVRTFHGER